MKSVAVLAAAAGLVGAVSAHGNHHEHLHKRGTTAAPSSTPCPQWTGGHRPPAYLTNLPLSVQAELPTWTGAPPPDWCSETAWMQSYVSCATVYESCSSKTTTTSSSTTSSSTTTTGSTTSTSSSTTSSSNTKTGSTTSTSTTSGTWTGTGTWSTSADPATTSTSTWGTGTGTWSTSADPATTSTSTWGSWVDPASSSSSSSSSAAWGTWASSVDPASTSTSRSTSFTGWGSWVDPASSSSSSSSSFTTWGSWLDPTSTATSSSSTAWGTWASSVDPASTSTSSSSTTWATWADPASSSVCGCTTVIVTVTGDPTWIPDSPTTTSVSTTTYTTVTVVPTQVGTSSTTTTWGSWDPTTSSSSSSSSTTSWGSWADGSSISSSSTTFSTAWSVTTGSSTATPSPSSSGGSGNAAIAPAGSLWAITYSPYTSSGGCKDAGSVTADITAIKALGFTTVRIYSTDCSGLENVGTAARAVGLKLILGVFIESSGISGAQPQVSEIIAWGQWDLVEMIIIGNEALFNNYLSVSDLSGFITSSKWAFSGAGYKGPVTTTEPLNIWQEEGSSLCGAIDVVAANIHAFFNPNTAASQAGAFIESELTILETICPGKATYVVESGWPHAGEANGAAVPGIAEQATALASIQSTCGAQVVFFTFEDDLWKAPGAFEVEQNWGCASAF